MAAHRDPTSGSRPPADLLIDNQNLTRILFDHALGLLFADGSGLHIESGFLVRSATDEPHAVPAGGALAATTLLAALHQPASAEHRGGVLDVHLANSITLQVHPDDRYESWNLTGADGSNLICLPGGELMSVPPRPR